MVALVAMIAVLLARGNEWPLTRRSKGETTANGSNRVEIVSQPFTLD